MYVRNPDSRMEESEAQPARPGVDYVWLGEGCHYWQVRVRVHVRACVRVWCWRAGMLN